MHAHTQHCMVMTCSACIWLISGTFIHVQQLLNTARMLVLNFRLDAIGQLSQLSHRASCAVRACDHMATYMYGMTSVCI